MGPEANDSNRRTPPWVWAIIVGVGLIPLLNLGLRTVLPPEGLVPSGLHTVDTYCYLTPMRYMPEGFKTPYAQTHHAAMPAGHEYYGMPYHYLYGTLGVIAEVIRVPDVFILALANGLGIAFLIWAVWQLLNVLMPGVARTAFPLAVIGGGVGGVVGLVICALGLWDDSGVAVAFPRWFRYDLVEGTRSNLHLLQDRLYYTLPLGLAFLGWLRLHKQHAWQAGTLIALATLINFRIGPMVWAVALLPVLTGLAPTHKRSLSAWTVGMFVGLAAALLIAGRNPSHFTSSTLISREAIAFAAFLGASAWLLPPACAATLRSLRAAQGWTRYAAWALAGYLTTWALLYAAYHAYYGNWLTPVDFAAATRISDPALIGILPGLLLAHMLSPRDDPKAPPSWVLLWLLGALAVGISAWGEGWFLRLAPQRVIVLCGIPLAVLAAYGLQPWRAPLRMAYLAITLTFGATSLLFTWGISHGPFGDTQASVLLPWTRFAYITEADARAIDQVDAGVVLTPANGAPLYGDVIANRTDCSVVYGNGTLDFSRKDLVPLRRRVSAFFSPEASEEERRSLLADWNVRYILCPARSPVDPIVRDQLRQLPDVEVVYEEGEVLLLEVKPSVGGGPASVAGFPDPATQSDRRSPDR
jgi:hypothetical protein